MALAYLLDPCEQYQDRSGVNNVNGWFEVFISDTDDNATVYTDFNGTLAPEHIGIDLNGRAVMIVESALTYRVEMYEPNGHMVFSQYPVWPQKSGGGVAGVDIVSTDGTIAIDRSSVGSLTTYDLSAHVEDSAQSLSWIRCDGATNLTGTDTWKPTYTAGTMSVGTKGIILAADQYYHATARVRISKSSVAGYYDDLQLVFKTFDGAADTQVCRKGIIVDGSLALYQDFEISCDVLAGTDCELCLDVTGKELANISIDALDIEVHRVYSGAPYIPGGGGGGGGGGDYEGGTGILVNNTTREISVDSSVVALKGELSQYVTDSELETILSGYATTSDLSQYATKNELTYGLSGKQDVLTAGENITIVNNVISATGGGSTYTAGTGIDITGDVISVDTTTIATKTDLSGKQDVIGDLSDIRSGAAAGATAVQPAALNDYATTSAMNTALAGKQDTISDLQTIREGAAAGATAVQPATLNDYVTTSAMNTALAGKQDVLTAGSNVQISGSTISATDTTYTAGTGLSLTGTEFSVDSATVAMKTDLPDLTQYVTDTELSTILQGYQTALTAGSNITISNGTISATDTTYTAGTGLNLSNGEFSVDTSTIATQTDLSGKQDTLTAGTGISITNNTISCTASFTQQQANWAQTNTSAVDYIKNKPTIPTVPALKELVAGNNISMVETSSNVTISATDVPTIGTVTV